MHLSNLSSSKSPFILVKRLGQRASRLLPAGSVAISQAAKPHPTDHSLPKKKPSSSKTSIIITCGVQDSDNERRRSAASGPMPPHCLNCQPAYDERVLNLDPKNWELLPTAPGIPGRFMKLSLVACP